MRTWLYPGWAQGSDNDKIRERADDGDDREGDDGA